MKALIKLLEKLANIMGVVADIGVLHDDAVFEHRVAPDLGAAEDDDLRSRLTLIRLTLIRKP